MAGGKSANGTNVCIYKKNTSKAQLWKPSKIVVPTSVSLSTSSKTLTGIGQTQKITAKIAPSNITEKNVTWSTSEKRVATISNGIVTAKGSGKAVITAQTSNGKTASVTIEVKDNCANIAEGLYNLNSGVDKNMMLDVAGNQTVNGSKVQIYKNNNGMAQKFYVKNAGFGWYEIYNAYPNRCLDVKNGENKDGATVQLYDQNNSAAQKWRFYQAKNGFYFLMNQLGRYLDVAVGSKQNGAKVQIWQGNKTTAQQWKPIKTSADFLNIAEGLYNISTRLDANMMLDVASNGTENGTNIQIYKKNPGIAQKFYIKNAGGNWYTISNPFSKKNLDVAGGKAENQTNVHLYEPNSSKAQRWRFCLTQDQKHLKIKSMVGNNFCLDVFGANKANGSNVNIWGGNNTEAQQWKLHKTSIIDLTGIKFNAGSLSLNKGQTKKLSVTYMPANATAAKSKLNWSTSNGGVATVSDNGEVTAVGAGTATITAKSYNEKTASVTITVHATQNTYTTKEVRITSNGQTVDTFNGVAAQYIMGLNNSDTGDYCCANYVEKYYRKTYGVVVSNMFTGKTPKASKGSFRVTSTPKAGDVGYQTNKNNRGHWFIVKAINSNGTYTIIEQNWKSAKGGSTYCTINRRVSYANTSGLKFFRWYK